MAILRKYQKGDRLEYRDPTVKVYEQGKLERSYYDPIEEKMHLSYEDAQNPESVSHEFIHHFQNLDGNMNTVSPAARATIPMSNYGASGYFNRRGEDVQGYLDWLKAKKDPTLTFMNDDILYDKIVDSGMYSDASTVEGDAQANQRGLAEDPEFQHLLKSAHDQEFPLGYYEPKSLYQIHFYCLV